MRRTCAVAGAVLAVSLVAGCGQSGGGRLVEAELSGTLTVFAAASLTDVFTELGDRMEDRNPDLDIRFNFAASSALATQIVQGAPADLFASANQPQMAVVTDEGLEDRDPQVFAENVLEIAVPAGNPGGVTGLADFSDPDLVLAVCAAAVPCGAASTQVFEAAGVTAVPDTEEEDVRAALTKVQLGEVDAALVYATDVRSAGDDVEGIAFPESEEAVNDYPLCVLADAPNLTAARAFSSLVFSDEGQQALADAGFRPAS
jgi:molybdate transport system substrate-binding protein